MPFSAFLPSLPSALSQTLLPPELGVVSFQVLVNFVQDSRQRPQKWGLPAWMLDFHVVVSAAEGLGSALPTLTFL